MRTRRSRDAAGALPGGEPRPGRDFDGLSPATASTISAPVEVWRSAHDRASVVDHAVDEASSTPTHLFIVHAGAGDARSDVRVFHHEAAAVRNLVR